ncbi:MAG: hypothetical protein ACRCS8_00050 [Brevinema sp.]
MSDNQRLDRIEKDMRELTRSTNENTSAIREISTLLKSFMEIVVEDHKEILKDHEDRIRQNTKFVYQAMAIFAAVTFVANVLPLLIAFKQ